MILIIEYIWLWQPLSAHVPPGRSLCSTIPDLQAVFFQVISCGLAGCTGTDNDCIIIIYHGFLLIVSMLNLYILIWCNEIKISTIANFRFARTLDRALWQLHCQLFRAVLSLHYSSWMKKEGLPKHFMHLCSASEILVNKDTKRTYARNKSTLKQHPVDFPLFFFIFRDNLTYAGSLPH